MSESTPSYLNNPDPANRSAGEMLRAARESQHMSVEGLASIIKVTTNKIEAMEAGQFEQVGDPNFTRALAMTICRALKVDSAPVLAALPPAALRPPVSAKPPINQPFKDVRFPVSHSSGPNWTAVLSPKWLAPILVLLAAAVVYLLPDSFNWGTGAESPESAASAADAASAPLFPEPVPEFVPVPMAPETPGDPSASAPELGATSSELAPAATEAPVSVVTPPSTLVLDTAPTTSNAPTPVATVPPGAERVILSLTQDSWIEVRGAGNVKLLSRYVRAGERLELDGVPPIKAHLGNAHGVELTFRGQRVDLAPLTRNNVARVELK